MLKDFLDNFVSQNEVLAYYSANVTIIMLPDKIDGFVYNYKGINNIFINKNLSYYRRKKTLLHELAHIELNHLCQCNNDLLAFHIKKYEDEADEYINFLLE